MAWKTITADDVKSALSAAETAAIGTVSIDSGQTDPITNRIQYTQDMIRGYIRKRFSLGASGIPQGLFEPALAIIVYRGLLRVAPNLAEKRKADFDAAMSILKDVRDGDWIPEEPITATTEVAGTPSPLIVGSDAGIDAERRGFDRASQDGI